MKYIEFISTRCMKCSCWLGIWLTLATTSAMMAQSSSLMKVDSFNLQRATIQDTFLLRVIPAYIQARLTTTGEINFQRRGVLLVIIPRIKSDSLTQYRIRTEYDNYGLLNRWKYLHPLFYTQVGGRYVVVCDEWTGQLMPLSVFSQEKVIDEFVRSKWLNRVGSPEESLMEIHSIVYFKRGHY